MTLSPNSAKQLILCDRRRVRGPTFMEAWMVAVCTIIYSGAGRLVASFWGPSMAKLPLLQGSQGITELPLNVTACQTSKLASMKPPSFTYSKVTGQHRLTGTFSRRTLLLRRKAATLEDSHHLMSCLSIGKLLAGILISGNTSVRFPHPHFSTGGMTGAGEFMSFFKYGRPKWQ
ncbi:conserved hypothetical protein [Coccidioides posadasii str. Silveira]|uniref:Uncharacterized protein n=1 Tax=Coccidioides posadasii (strain RMSCC 757 / Silveira) TaxID=443226 RepID=E9CY62_COCPS|nr:conserved hypothetical protein [Coccidioides posadasii str. Silveira]